MHIFLSAGEPSGDLHAANLVRALRQLDPGAECVGFGGERLQTAGCRLLYPLCGLAIMGLSRVLTSLHLFLRLLWQADRYFRKHRPDRVVLVDFPGFNWWVARRAHAHGIPVYYFVPPQLWAWAGWRVGKMRRSVDQVLCNLPFEKGWYQDRNVPACYIGHPYFDELTQQGLDEHFLAEQRSRPGTIIGLLPGSRTQEVEHNLATVLGAAERIHRARPETRFLVACFKEEHARLVAACLTEHSRGFIEVHTARTAEILQLAHSCVAVSGSVGLELLYRGKPAVVVYRVPALLLRLIWVFKKSPYISLVNLLAEKELFPEYLSDRCEAEVAAEHILHWLRDDDKYRGVCRQLGCLRDSVAQPGACRRAAELILGRVDQRMERLIA
jgi:lipid-A-disaccharide synthase